MGTTTAIALFGGGGKMGTRRSPRNPFGLSLSKPHPEPVEGLRAIDPC